jgi:hypothetical protein
LNDQLRRVAAAIWPAPGIIFAYETTQRHIGTVIDNGQRCMKIRPPTFSQVVSIPFGMASSIASPRAHRPRFDGRSPHLAVKLDRAMRQASKGEATF